MLRQVLGMAVLVGGLWGGTASTAEAAAIRVGDESATSRANLVVHFGDGAVFQFDVALPEDATTTGIGLLEIVDAATPLAVVIADFGWGKFVDGLSYETHSNVGYLGGEDWWHYWTGSGTPQVFGAPEFGANDRVVGNGSWDGWVYGTAAAPVPEPATIGLAAAGLAFGLLRRR